MNNQCSAAVAQYVPAGSQHACASSSGLPFTGFGLIAIAAVAVGILLVGFWLWLGTKAS